MRLPHRRAIGGLALAALTAVTVAGCGGTDRHVRTTRTATTTTAATTSTTSSHPTAAVPRVPPLLDSADVYAADRPGMLTGAALKARSLVYVPNSESATVDEIDPRTYRIVRHFPVGALPQHIVPSYDLTRLWVTNDIGNSLTPIDPRTGTPGRPVPVEDPYNLYFSPNGTEAIVMAERLRRIDFRDAHTMALRHSLAVPMCAGVNHADFTRDGRYMLATCEFGSALVVVDLSTEKIVRRIVLPAGSSPQDVKLAPDGRVFYVADLTHGGVFTVTPRHWRVTGLIPTGAGAHGLYPSRDSQRLYISNRGAGSVSVLDFHRRRVTATWHLPGGGSPDMGGVSADGRVLWLSGRYDGVVYAIDTQTGHLLRSVKVGAGPHGLCVWPQPGRYSLGHTGILR